MRMVFVGLNNKSKKQNNLINTVFEWTCGCYPRNVTIRSFK